MTDNTSAGLVVRKRRYHGQSLWWIGRGSGKSFVPYFDIYGPTGYGYFNKDFAIQAIKEIEERGSGLSSPKSGRAFDEQ